VSETILLLARHGATTCNLRRPYVLQGQSVDYDLDVLGVQQATALAEALAGQTLAAVYTSPLLRAARTAAIAAAPHSLVPIPVDEIKEANAGLWEGKSWDVIDSSWPAEKTAHDNDPGVNGYPGGESFGQVRDRSAPAFQAMAQRHPGQTVLAVSHNVVNRSVLAHWTGIPLKYARRIPQYNAAYNVVVFENGSVKVRTINGAGHLAGLIPPD
jgi:broad specificity phosphatase PhoE